MPVSLILWRLLVGRFNGSKLYHKCFRSHVPTGNNFCPSLVVFIILLLLSGDVHPNPGPKRDKDYNFSLCCWNIGSISAHNFSKLSLLSSYNSIYNYDLICLSETFLDSSFLPDDPRLSLDGYNLIRADHPNDVKRGGVCVYVKNSLATRVSNLSNLKECIIIELTLKNKKGYVISLYRSPSQSMDEFEEFLLNLDQTLHDISSLNPSFVMLLGDFNAKSSSWCSQDITSSEGFRIETLTSFYSFTQLISLPTHILPNSSSCIDLIFVDQPNIIRNSGVHSSLHTDCNHQIIYLQFNLKIDYPPPYERLVWNYNKANVESINLAINRFDWENLFAGKNVNEQVYLFNRTILNIFKNFIPNRIVTFDDSDPPWVNEQIKSLIQLKNQMFKLYVQNGKKQNDYISLQNANHQLSDLLNLSKKKY